MASTIGIIRQAATGATSPPPQHPKATLRAEDGYTMVLKWAPTGAELGGWGVTWAALERPGRRAIVARTGEGLPTLGLTFLVGDPDHQVDVEDELASLRRLAEGGQRITLVNLSPNEAGPWRIDDVKVSATLRQHGTNRITRGLVTLSLVLATDVATSATVVPRYTRKSPKKAFWYRVKSGDTLKSISYRYYGDPYAYSYIVKRNKLKSTKLKKGRRLVIPTIPLG